MRDGWSVVTGGAGFIGRHLVRQLRVRGARVRVLDIDASPGQFGAGVDVVRGSVLDADAVDATLRGAVHVYHLAANPQLWARRKRQFRDVNTEGTRTLLRGAARAGVQRIVVTSTETVLAGARPVAGEMINETAPPPSIAEMAGPYCESKWLADQLAREAGRRGLPVVLVYPTIPVGSGDVHLTPPTRMILSFLNGRVPAYLDCHLNLVAVEDVAAGHILAARRGRVGESYILGNENMRLSELLAMLQEISGLPMPRIRLPYWVAYGFGVVSELLADHVFHSEPIAPLTGVKLAGRSQRFDCRKAHELLRMPRSSIRGALERSVRWLFAQGLVDPRRAQQAGALQGQAAAMPTTVARPRFREKPTEREPATGSRTRRVS